MKFVSENYEVVTCIAKEIAEGKDRWQELMRELDAHKKMMCRKYHAYLSKFCSYEDIVATYEDCIIDTIPRLSSEVENYITLLSVSFKTRIIDLHKYYTRQKRAVWVETSEETYICDIKSLNMLDASTNMEYGDLIADEGSVSQYEVVETLIQLQTAIKQFALLGNTQKEQAALLMVELSSACSGNVDRKQELLAVLPDGTSWDSCRQKLKRAKDKFKLFYDLCHRG